MGDAKAFIHDYLLLQNPTVIIDNKAEWRFEEILKEYPKYGKNYKTLQRYLGYHQDIQGLIKRAGYNIVLLVAAREKKI